MSDEDNSLNCERNLDGLKGPIYEESRRCLSTAGTFYDTPERRAFLNSSLSYGFAQENVEKVINFANMQSFVKRESVYRFVNETVGKYSFVAGFVGGVLSTLAIRNLTDSSDVNNSLLRGIVTVGGFCMGWMSTGYIGARMGFNRVMSRLNDSNSQ